MAGSYIGDIGYEPERTTRIHRDTAIKGNQEVLGKSSMPFEKLKLDNTSGLILPVISSLSDV